jgi:hypothetical protein
MTNIIASRIRAFGAGETDPMRNAECGVRNEKQKSSFLLFPLDGGGLALWSSEIYSKG